MLWNGGNENIWGHEDWEWKQSLADRTWGLAYYEEIFPDIVAELDPTRPYCPGISVQASRAASTPTITDFGCMHIWDVWNHADYTHYATYTTEVRFRVRIPGTADLGDTHRRHPRRTAEQHLTGHARSPEG